MFHVKQFLLALGFLYLFSFGAHALKLYLLSNHDNVGDHNQALGVKNALSQLSPDKILIEDLNTKTVSSSQIKEAIEKDLSQQQVIVVATGEGGIDGIKDLTPASHLIICLTSHMPLERYQDPSLVEKVNFIALPIHVSDKLKTQLNSKLIETTGVAHNRLPTIADQAYVEWGTKELPPAKVYLSVILGGDAPTPSKEIRLFTEEDATKL